MGKNYFSKEQIEILTLNPYVKNISEKAITYTEEFSEKFFIRYQENPLPSKILHDIGLDSKNLVNQENIIFLNVLNSNR